MPQLYNSVVSVRDLLTGCVLWNVKGASRMTMGLGEDSILSSSVFSMPMIASARTPWRTPALDSEWLIKLTDPRDAENSKGNGQLVR